MPLPANLVHQQSTSTGTGNFTLTAVNGKQSFSTAFGTGVTTDVFDYFIANQGAAEWERGTGHMSASNTLVRDTIKEGSNGTSAVNFSAGTKDVVNDIPASQQFVYRVDSYGAKGDGTTDDGPAFNAAITAAPAGAIVLIPPPPGGSTYKIGTSVAVNKTVTLCGWGASSQAPSVTIAGAITGFNMTATGAKLGNFRIDGDRTTNQIGIQVTGVECLVENMQIDGCDYGIKQATGAGNHISYSRIWMRNHKTTAVWLQDGVGPRLFEVMYDTDGTWYGGSTAAPTTAGIHLQTEGAILTNCDILHASVGLKIECSSTRQLEWGLFNNCYFDSNTSHGIEIINNDASKYIRGLFFNQVWSATSGVGGNSAQGIYIHGTGTIDGLTFTACPIHNNNDAGIYASGSSIKNIVIRGCTIAGNNVRAASANGVYLNVATQCIVQDNWFGRQDRWTSDPLYHLYLDSSQGNTLISGNYFDTNAASGALQNATSSTVDIWLNKGLTSNASARTNLGVRDVLSANRTYYVRTDGSDSNTGLANTSGAAFLTIQKAINTIVALDLAGFAVTIQVADGTYTGAVSLTTPFLGGNVTLQGNNATPSNVVISTTSADGISTNGYGIALTVKDLKIQTTTAGNCLYAQNGSVINFQNLVFGACAERHVRANSYAHILATGNFTIAGSAIDHVLAFGGFYELAALTVTLTGTPAFSGKTFNLDSAGSVSLFSVTFSGSATGKRYSVTLNSVLNSFGSGTASTYFPGNSNGTTATGGQQA